jgi:hypothetical protein
MLNILMEHLAEEYATGIARIRRLRKLSEEEEKDYNEKVAKKKEYEKVIYGEGLVSDRIFSNP